LTGLGKQAKTLSDIQLRTLLRFVESETEFPDRNRALVLLSFKAGLRAKEIAGVTWRMVSDTEGHVASALALTNGASKGRRGGRVMPLHADLKAALVTLHEVEHAKGRAAPGDFLINFSKGATETVTRSNSVQFLFRSWFAQLGFAGASSHSGRRTFITRAARKVSEVGGSLRDVQALAGHSSIATTQRYIDADPDAQRRLIDLL
jgi:integrase